eukprot:RCo004775
MDVVDSAKAVDDKWLLCHSSANGNTLAAQIAESLDSIGTTVFSTYFDSEAVLNDEWTGFLIVAATDSYEGVDRTIEMVLTLLKWAGETLLRRPAPKLVVLTCGAQVALEDPFSSAVWGLVRCARVENPALDISCVDVSRDCPAEYAAKHLVN